MGLYGNLTKEPKKSECGLMKGKFANTRVLLGLFMQLFKLLYQFCSLLLCHGGDIFNNKL